MRIAVMQPYFVPYAGYFRLFALADLFIAFDCVQFPRRGWVHRNKLPDTEGNRQWLTLPLDKHERDIKINQLNFSAGADKIILDRMARFPCLKSSMDSQDNLIECIKDTRGDVVTYLLDILRICCERLELPYRVIRSSELDIDPDLHGDERIRAIMRSVGATEYINPPGGRDLYSRRKFEKAGMELQFLSDYEGSMDSILHRLLTESAPHITNELQQQLSLEVQDA